MRPNLTAKNLTGHASHLAQVADGDVVTGKPLAPYTSYRIGGPTAIWVEPRSEEGVRRVMETVHAAGVDDVTHAALSYDPIGNIGSQITMPKP